ncbi:hypothetical protein LJ737_10555 [Hymenobacter sp. 15J16-1T3B]|uniref:hypothetical protein n=1 Tax=Hymenobacter sp. 15J16-1T3B TaxID=2886941 RepID=UPI001D0F983C|nr:hypothetical protein [Hymenobacter sp. 15J16-1T3B]MCC3157682.1 hypothetical protein [Hymenobacter sp. 15J16-1T3B]
MKATLTRVLLAGGLLGLLLPEAAQAQRTLRNPWTGRTELQLELARQNGDFFWGSLHGQHSFGKYGELFEYNWVQAGYEHFWSERWSWGANLRAAFYSRDYDNRGLQFLPRPELLVRHRGDVFGFTFGQRLSLDYEFRPEPQRNLGQARLRLDLERVYSVNERVKLRPRVAYEAAANIRLQPPDDQPDERTLEQGIWRAEIGLRLSDHVDLTPYVARQSDFAVYLPQFDADGNIVSGGRTNVRTPVVGVDLRFTLFEDKEPFKRIQLPTQH